MYSQASTKFILSTVIAAATYAVGVTPAFGKNVFKQVAEVATAPVTASVEVGKTVANGKAPSAGQLIKAASPELAQAAAVAETTGVSQGIKNVTQLPAKANNALDNANGAINEAKDKMAEIGSLVAALKDLPAKIVTPIQALLWLLVAWVASKIVQGFRAPKRTA